MRKTALFSAAGAALVLAGHVGNVHAGTAPMDGFAISSNDKELKVDWDVDGRALRATIKKITVERRPYVYGAELVAKAKGPSEMYTMTVDQTGYVKVLRWDSKRDYFCYLRDVSPDSMSTGGCPEIRPSHKWAIAMPSKSKPGTWEYSWDGGAKSFTIEYDAQAGTGAIYSAAKEELARFGADGKITKATNLNPDLSMRLAQAMSVAVILHWEIGYFGPYQQPR